MHSCQSPVKSYAGSSVADTASPPRGSRVSVSLNGLFGELSGFEDPISFTTQSPPCGNLLHSSASLSTPSKSPIISSTCGQPVLLSEFTECSPHSGSPGGLFRGSTLCSYVSHYDNSRCTNLAAATCGVGKSFCRNHLELARPIEVCNSSTFIQYVNTTTPNLTCVNGRPYPISQVHAIPQFVPSSNCFQQKQGISRGIALNTLNGNIGRRNQTILSNSLVNGVDVGDGQASFSNAATSNIIFPVSCITSPNQIAGNNSVKKSKGQSRIASNAVQSNITTAAVIDKNAMKLGSPHVGNAKLASASPVSNKSAPMDGDVLQAFVDFLNQNQDRLSAKEQIDLLNSLGVAVATVKNPGELQVMNKAAQVTKPPLACRNSKNKVNPTAVNIHDTAPLFNGQLPTLENSIPPTSLKRKITSSFQLNGAKKPKKGNPISKTNSLSHLSSSELDERVLEALASVGGLPMLNKQVPKSEAFNQFESKSCISVSNTVVKKPTYKHAAVPSVTIPMHESRCAHLLNEKLPSKLKEYARLHVDKSLKGENLFPLGPFCDDNDLGICRCVALQCKIHPPAKLKQKAHAKSKSKSKIDQCVNCMKVDTKHPSLSYAEHSLHAASNATASCKTDGHLLAKPNLQSTPIKLTTDGATASQTSVISNHCRNLDNSAKIWTNLYKEEKKAMKLLVDAAQSDLNETAKVLKKLGTRPATCTRRHGVCASMPTRCKLTDRTGDQCTKTSLPLSPYCRDHIWHLDYQQLYKLGADMNVVADICPDLPTAKQRKKTKLPPLSKRKKRRVKKGKLALKLQAAQNKLKHDTPPMDETMELKPALENTTNSNDADNVIDIRNYDEITDLQSAPLSSVDNDPSLSQKLEMSNDDIPVVNDEGSNSGVFESLSLDGTELLGDVMPDVFSEFGLFAGKNGEVLDSALLLAGAVDPENPDRLNIDKLSFDELNDNSLFFTNMENDDLMRDSLNINSQVKSPLGLSENNDTDLHMPSEFPTIETTNVPTFTSVSQSNDSIDNTVTSDIPTSTPTSETMMENSKWLSSQFGESSQEGQFYTNIAGDGFCDPSSSLDSSFADDLNELEGVILSLQAESDHTNSQLPASKPCSMNADEYTSILARELSLDVENQAFGSPESSLPISGTTQPTDNLSIPTVTCHVAQSTKTKQSFSNHTLPRTIDRGQPLQEQNPLPLRGNDERILVENKQKQRVKTPKKSKNKVGLKKHVVDSVCNMPMEQILPSLKDGSVKSNTVTASQKNSSTSQCTATTLTTKSLPNTTTGFQKAKMGKRPRCSVPVPGFLPSNVQPMVALSPSFRMQPRMMSGNVLCAAGKINTAGNNQSMVLIPVNAIVRTNNQMNVPGSSQGLGIAFAIPAQANFANNMGAVLPVRGSTILSGANNTQQLIILSGNQPLNASLCTNVSVNQFSTPTTLSKTQKDTTNMKSSSSAVKVNPSINVPITSNTATIPSDTKMQPKVCLSPTAKVKVLGQHKMTTATPTPESSVPCISAQSKHRTTFKRESPLVIPPVLNNQSTTVSSQTSTTKNNQTIGPTKLSTPVSVTHMDGVKTSPSKGGTVHWNQTMAGPDTPPLPQPRMFGSVGGQTSNMLYCRRISPSLNNPQQVIVGRLGSLGRVGLSHLKITDQINKFEKSTKSNHTILSKTSSEAKMGSSGSLPLQEKVVSKTPLSVNEFIPLSTITKSPSPMHADRITSTNTGDIPTPVIQTTSQALILSQSSESTDKKGKVTDLNATSPKGHCTMNGVLENNTSTAGNDGKDPEASKPSCLSSTRHNSRKSDHTMTLQDPDFCESPTKVGVVSAKTTVCDVNSSMTASKDKRTILKGNNSTEIIATSSERCKESDILLNGGKSSRRAAILRKR